MKDVPLYFQHITTFPHQKNNDTLNQTMRYATGWVNKRLSETEK